MVDSLLIPLPRRWLVVPVALLDTGVQKAVAMHYRIGGPSERGMALEKIPMLTRLLRILKRGNSVNGPRVGASSRFCLCPSRADSNSKRSRSICRI
jgi:hypothetical protein